MKQAILREQSCSLCSGTVPRLDAQNKMTWRGLWGCGCLKLFARKHGCEVLKKTLPRVFGIVRCYSCQHFGHFLRTEVALGQLALPSGTLLPFPSETTTTFLKPSEFLECMPSDSSDCILLSFAVGDLGLPLRIFNALLHALMR